MAKSLHRYFKGILQGVTYEELSKMTGEPLRDVSFYLPGTSIAVLKQIPEYSDFNPAKEVLLCKKPGTSSVDAPSLVEASTSS